MLCELRRIHRRASSTTVRAPKWGIPTHPDGVLGTVAEILCPVGSAVLEGETMAVVETDKMSAEVKAPHSGIVRKILVQVDEDVKQGQPVYTMDYHAISSADEGTQERRWAFDVAQRKAREAHEAKLNWQRWQQRWQREQSRRWEEWQKRSREQMWWRQHQANWRRQRQGQRQQQQQEHRRRRSTEQQQAVQHLELLPAGDVKRMLMARDHYEACASKFGPARMSRAA